MAREGWGMNQAKYWDGWFQLIHENTTTVGHDIAGLRRELTQLTTLMDEQKGRDQLLAIHFEELLIKHDHLRDRVKKVGQKIQHYKSYLARLVS